MTRSALAMTLLAVLSAPLPAWSHARDDLPVLSGKYVFTGQRFCPEGQPTTTTLWTGTFTFLPKTQMVSWSQYSFNGYNSITGFKTTETYAVSSNGSDIILTMGSQPWFMTYNNGRHGDVRSFALMSKSPDSGSCANQLLLTR